MKTRSCSRLILSGLLVIGSASAAQLKDLDLSPTQFFYNIPDQKILVEGDVTSDVADVAEVDQVLWAHDGTPDEVLKSKVSLPIYSVAAKNFVMSTKAVLNPQNYFTLDTGKKSVLRKYGINLTFTADGMLAGAKYETTDQFVPLLQSLAKLAFTLGGAALMENNLSHDSPRSYCRIQAATREEAVKQLDELEYLVALFNRRAQDRLSLRDVTRDILDLEKSIETSTAKNRKANSAPASATEQFAALESRKLVRDLIAERIASYTEELSSTKHIKNECLPQLDGDEPKSQEIKDKVLVTVPVLTNAIIDVGVKITLSGQRLKAQLDQVGKNKHQPVDFAAFSNPDVFVYRVPLYGTATVSLVKVWKATFPEGTQPKKESLPDPILLPVTVTQLGTTRYLDPKASFAEDKSVALTFFSDTAAVQSVTVSSSSSLASGLVNIAQQYADARKALPPGATEQSELDTDNKLLKARLDNHDLKEKYDALVAAQKTSPAQ